MASARSSLGRALHTLGELEEAEAVLRSVLDVRRELMWLPQFQFGGVKVELNGPN